MISEAFILSFAAALFSMMNPLGAVGIFAGMIGSRTEAESKKISVTCGFSIAITLLVVNWLGVYFLSFFGISIASLQAAGGIVILIMGLNMIFNKSDHKTSRGEISDSLDKGSIAVVPLAIPIVAGPGAMATVLLAASHHKAVSYKFEITLVIVGLAIFTSALFYYARPITRSIGKAGMGVVTRVMGLILCAIAMGLIADGLKTLFPGLAA